MSEQSRTYPGKFGFELSFNDILIEFFVCMSGVYISVLESADFEIVIPKFVLYSFSCFETVFSTDNVIGAESWES